MTSRLVIRTAHTTFCGADWHWDSRLQAGDFRLGYNLWYVVKGRGRLETAEGGFDLGPGDCFVLRSWEKHLGTADPADPVVVSWCCYDFVDAAGRRVPPERLRLPPRHRRLAETAFFAALMERLVAAFQAAADGQEAGQWLQVALTEVAGQDRRFKTLQGTDLEHAERIGRICRAIREAPGRMLRIPLLAAQASMCVDHFIRVFKRHAGMTPGEYIISCRIEAARGLLQSSSHNISQIAERLGYPNVYAFSKQFKQRTGQAPSVYRG